jgi:hypothetical protein
LGIDGLQATTGDRQSKGETHDRLLLHIDR